MEKQIQKKSLNFKLMQKTKYQLVNCGELLFQTLHFPAFGVAFRNHSKPHLTFNIFNTTTSGFRGAAI